MAEPTDEWTDTDDDDGGLDNLGVSSGVVARAGSREVWAITDGCGGPSEIGEGAGAETGFHIVCDCVDPAVDTRLGMSIGASRDGLAGVLTETEFRGDMAESL